MGKIDRAGITNALNTTTAVHGRGALESAVKSGSDAAVRSAAKTTVSGTTSINNRGPIDAAAGK